MSNNNIAKTPSPPYYAVLFTSPRTREDRGYRHMAERMMELAAEQPGFLGVESVRGADGLGITVSYWSSEQEIAAWKEHADHQIAQETGRRVWYSDYFLRVAKVERDYGKLVSDTALEPISAPLDSQLKPMNTIRIALANLTYSATPDDSIVGGISRQGPDRSVRGTHLRRWK
jgi:heme-degrading monooxygenase HmoA